MQILGTVTSQGQLTIPLSVRNLLGLSMPSKVKMEVVKEGLLIRPKTDFWNLGGALKSNISLSDEEMREAREAFGRDLAKHARGNS